MNTSDLRTYLSALPKIELHRHLEGSIRLDTLVDVADQYNLDLPARTAAELRAHVQVTSNGPFDSFHFLQKFSVLRRFFISPAVIQRVAREAVIDAARDNIMYMELRFTPKALAKLMNYRFSDVVRWVCEAVNEEQQRHKIKVRLIVAINRHESIEEGAMQFAAALAYRPMGVVGIDLCGQEKGYPATPFVPIFRDAQKAGMGITIHAGEWDTSRNVAQAIEKIGATRIGHGVRILENNELVSLARDHNITFEVCPTSNLQSGVIPELRVHPLHDMNVLGLKTTLNTDDPAISNITLTDEYEVGMQLGMTLEDITQSVRRAAEASFLPAAERELLLAQIESAILGVPNVPDR